ncbi:TlpA family protein disulfide reductase [Flagellimonas sp.]|uniref:TlpA family protein disulfide reductase n=1 Tax=Flagellimonas sp. TaxID=2058762 RepID=UPI003B5B7596
MKTIKILLLLCLFANGCKSQQIEENTFFFKVSSENITTITISKYDYDQEKMIEWKSITNINPNETYNVANQFLEPSIYGVKLNTGKEVRIAVEQSGTINLQLDDGITLDSEVASELNFNQSIETLNNKFFAGMIQDFDQAMKENDQQKIAALEKKKDQVLVEFIKAMENLIREMGPSAKAYDALGYLDLYKNNKFFKEMLGKFETDYPSSGMSKSLGTRIEKADQLALGSKMANFKAMNKNGTLISLSDFRGSYVLVDFWASWCRPCRVENPKLLELYKTVKNVKFDIVGVSIDSNKDHWEKAIEKDKLEWNQILDSEQTIYKQYLLSSLPANFLLDKEGKIISKNITAQELKARLEELE